MTTDPSFDGISNYNKCVRRSLLPFLGDALCWLKGTATTKDVNSITKKSESTHCSTIHTRSYSIINIIMDKVDNMVHDVNNLYNTTTSLSTSLSYYQLVLHIRSVLVNLWDSLSYIISVSMNIIDYIDAATTGRL